MDQTSNGDYLSQGEIASDFGVFVGDGGAKSQPPVDGIIMGLESSSPAN